MTIRDALATCGLPSLEAELLLADALGKPRTWLLTHNADPLDEAQQRLFQGHVKRRKTGEPVAYIVGKKEFFGRMFAVDRHVLIPRPATETLVETARDTIESGYTGIREADSGIVIIACLPRGKEELGPVTHIVDVGTGSGCVAITLASLLPSLCVYATDSEEQALRKAEENVKAHALDGRITLGLGSLLDPVRTLRHPFLVVSNPPYVPEGFVGNEDLAHEPSSAIFAGHDGLTVIRPLIAACNAHPFCRGFVLECRSDQADAVLSSVGE